MKRPKLPAADVLLTWQDHGCARNTPGGGDAPVTAAARLICLAPRAMRLAFAPSPHSPSKTGVNALTGERAAPNVQRTQSGEGLLQQTPHPFEFSEVLASPSPPRGEGTTAVTALAGYSAVTAALCGCRMRRRMRCNCAKLAGEQRTRAIIEKCRQMRDGCPKRKNPQRSATGSRNYSVLFSQIQVARKKSKRNFLGACFAMRLNPCSHFRTRAIQRRDRSCRRKPRHVRKHKRERRSTTRATELQCSVFPSTDASNKAQELCSAHA
jgi:hypothetical protein